MPPCEQQAHCTFCLVALHFVINYLFLHSDLNSWLQARGFTNTQNSWLHKHTKLVASGSWLHKHTKLVASGSWLQARGFTSTQNSWLQARGFTNTQNSWLQALTNYLYKEKEVTLNFIFKFDFAGSIVFSWRIKVQSIFSRLSVHSFYR